MSQHHIVLHCMLLFLAQLKCPVIALVPFLGYPKQASNLILVCSRPSVRRTRWLLRLPTPSWPRPARGYAPAHPVARTMTVRAMSDPRFQLNIIKYRFNSKLLSTHHMAWSALTCDVRHRGRVVGLDGGPPAGRPVHGGVLVELILQRVRRQPLLIFNNR